MNIPRISFRSKFKLRWCYPDIKRTICMHNVHAYGVVLTVVYHNNRLGHFFLLKQIHGLSNNLVLCVSLFDQVSSNEYHSTDQPIRNGCFIRVGFWVISVSIKSNITNRYLNTKAIRFISNWNCCLICGCNKIHDAQVSYLLVL